MNYINAFLNSFTERYRLSETILIVKCHHFHPVVLNLASTAGLSAILDQSVKISWNELFSFPLLRPAILRRFPLVCYLNAHTICCLKSLQLSMILSPLASVFLALKLLLSNHRWKNLLSIQVTWKIIILCQICLSCPKPLKEVFSFI